MKIDCPNCQTEFESNSGSTRCPHCESKVWAASEGSMARKIDASISSANTEKEDQKPNEN